MNIQSEGQGQAFGDKGLNQLLEEARKKLVETGTRNRLIHVNRDNKRANSLKIINERADDVFDLLKSKGRKMRFLATGKDKHAAADEDEILLLEEIAEDAGGFDEARYTDNQLETPLGPDAQQKRLLRLAKDARTAEEEQGINILFLAIGFLTWLEDKSSAVKREAPLILLPVDLKRNERTSTYEVVWRGDDIITNLPLQERLRQDFGINLPEIEADEDGWTPSHYFNQVREVIANKERWCIDNDGMELGFFSFAKLLMLRDLDPTAWGEVGLHSSPLIEGLLRSGFENETPLFDKNAKLDDMLEPADIVQVVDADSSQTKVIEEVRKGRNLVVQGPPGTGKSQTITNIIAAAVHDGKTVLFVAEKMAALLVVHSRLQKSGLASACLELHSRAANKKAVLQEIDRTLKAGSAVPNMPERPERLKQLRDQLNTIEKMLHSNVGGIDSSPFNAMAVMSKMAGIGAPPPTLTVPNLASAPQVKLEKAKQLLKDYATLKDEAGPRLQHPFRSVKALDLQPPDIQRLMAAVKRAIEHLQSLREALQKLDDLFGLESRTIQDAERILKVLALAEKAPLNTQVYLGRVAQSMSNPRFAIALNSAETWVTSKANATEFSSIAFQTPIAHIRSPLIQGSNSFFARLGSAYRTASRELASLIKQPLPKKATERALLLDKLIDLQEKRERFVQDRTVLIAILEEHWCEEDTPFSQISDVLSWSKQTKETAPELELDRLGRLLNSAVSLQSIADLLRQHLREAGACLAEIEASLDVSSEDLFQCTSFNAASIEQIIAWLGKLETNQGRYAQWCQYQRLVVALQAQKLDSLIERMDNGEFDAQAAINELNYAHAEASWAHARKFLPQLGSIANENRHEIVQAFRQNETQRLEDVQRLIKAKHLSQLPTGGIGEMAVIRGELAKKRAHKSIRKLIGTAGTMVQRIKPVMLMSPISVAQFLAPNAISFDLLVIDEASQVRPEDALGAIARARQIVVVGDKKQLPPTAFFDRMTSNDEEEEDEEDLLSGAVRATDTESILSLCEARSISKRMLEWHYRSRDPSLIAVSNAEFYEGDLVLPPSPLQNDARYGLRFIQVPGAYTPKSAGTGKAATNKIEAQEIVKAVIKHAAEDPTLSLGIVTFSTSQRNMVTEILEYERRKNALLDAFLREGNQEDLFVKSIENVQGDERDVILISVGYGPREPNGRLASMNFGPVNKEGGERRLNVLFSRARVRCDVFASFDPGEIDLARTQKEGTRILKRYLQYAKSGQLVENAPTGADADSPFEEDVANVIRKLGYEVDHQVGSAGFLIDLGVKHPDLVGQYMIAVECDGATYHSALWARERDRLRQDILENLGWHFHRIWSTDWFYRREQEIERLKQALENAAHLGGASQALIGANHSFVPKEDSFVENQDESFVISQLPENFTFTQPYTVAQVRVEGSYEPHEAPMSLLAKTVKRIVEIEGPIHQDEVARRLASAFGKEQAGRRIIQKTLDALNFVKGAIVNDETRAVLKTNGNFWFTDLQETDTPMRNRSDQTPSLQRADMLPPMEISAIAKRVVEESGQASQDEIIRAVAKNFGFDRVGSSLKEAITAVL